MGCISGPDGCSLAVPSLPEGPPNLGVFFGQLVMGCREPDDQQQGRLVTEVESH